MDNRRWYEAEALMADSTSRQHAILGAAEEEIEQRIRNRYPDAGRSWCEKRQEQMLDADPRHERVQGGFRR